MITFKSVVYPGSEQDSVVADLLSYGKLVLERRIDCRDFSQPFFTVFLSDLRLGDIIVTVTFDYSSDRYNSRDVISSITVSTVTNGVILVVEPRYNYRNFKGADVAVRLSVTKDIFDFLNSALAELIQ